MLCDLFTPIDANLIRSIPLSLSLLSDKLICVGVVGIKFSIHWAYFIARSVAQVVFLIEDKRRQLWGYVWAAWFCQK